MLTQTALPPFCCGPMSQILFGVMMTLVWIYIVLRKLCACCCGGKKRPVSIPAEGLNSPMARTGAPLLDSPKGATNPMQVVNEGVMGGGGGLRGYE